MAAHLRLTLDEKLYARLKRELPAKGISAFIAEAVRAKLRPDRRTLDDAYKAAAKESWRRELDADWSVAEAESWPE